jgi:hypothetical protein
VAPLRSLYLRGFLAAVHAAGSPAAR